jgi:DNA-binding NtrC family response regulator
MISMSKPYVEMLKAGGELEAEASADIRRALEKHHGSLGAMAVELGVSTTTVGRALSQLGLRAEATRLRAAAGLHDPRNGVSRGPGNRKPE